MSDKHCCVTWQELSVELSVAKEGEINELINSKGLPRSMFASVLKVLTGMTNYCPSCGSVLNPELQPKLQQQHKVAIKEVAQAVQESPTYTAKVKCAACAGRGILGIDRNKVKINCMKCHGSGELEAKHIATDPKAKQAQAKVDEAREATGIGDQALSVDAKGEIE